jgi:hypothetical protein
MKYSAFNRISKRLSNVEKIAREQQALLSRLTSAKIRMLAYKADQLEELRTSTQPGTSCSPDELGTKQEELDNSALAVYGKKWEDLQRFYEETGALPPMK